MKNRRIWIRGIIATFAMFLIILDTGTAVRSAQEGIQLCVRTVIPSLFPFFVLSGVINSCLLGRRFRFLRPIGRLCRIPKGGESLLLLGFLAGYPIGAQLITQAYRDGRLSESTARRMLGFCNNAGPSFIFGMLSPLFSGIKTLWVLWLVQILSALITGVILPAEPTSAIQLFPGKGITFTESLQKALKAIGGVCGWIVLFRVMIGFCTHWFFWLFPVSVQILISGVLELANGCVLLSNLSCEGMRFLLSGIFLSFGGLCVGMQTMSVTEGLGSGWYFPGKVLQTILCVLLCLFLQPFLFVKSEAVIFTPSSLLALVLSLMIYIFLLRRKKVVAFSGKLLYNTEN